MKAFVLLNSEGVEVAAVHTVTAPVIGPLEAGCTWVEVPFPVHEHTARWNVAEGCYEHLPRPPKPGRAVEVERGVKQARIMESIKMIESGQNRALREFALTGDRTRLQAIEDQIAKLRTELSN